MSKKFLTIKEASEYTRLSIGKIQQLIKAEDIPSYLKGGRRLFDIEELCDWVKGKGEN